MNHSTSENQLNDRQWNHRAGGKKGLLTE